MKCNQQPTLTSSLVLRSPRRSFGACLQLRTTSVEAANMCAALRVAHEEASAKGADDQKWESVVCAAHRLQTCLRRALDAEELLEMVRCARNLAGHLILPLRQGHPGAAPGASEGGEEVKKAHSGCVHQVEFDKLQRLLEEHVPVVAVVNDPDPTIDVSMDTYTHSL